MLAVGALNALQPSATRDRLLADVASGAVRVGRWRWSRPALCLTPRVPTCSWAITDGGGRRGGPPLTVTPQPVLDETRRLAAVSADGVEGSEVLRFAAEPEAAVRRLRDRAAVAVACDSLGLSEAMLSATVGYA